MERFIRAAKFAEAAVMLVGGAGGVVLSGGLTMLAILGHSQGGGLAGDVLMGILLLVSIWMVFVGIKKFKKQKQGEGHRG